MENDYSDYSYYSKLEDMMVRIDFDSINSNIKEDFFEEIEKKIGKISKEQKKIKNLHFIYKKTDSQKCIIQ